jgi:hypothetical protein
MTLNFALGYYRQDSKTVGPPVFYYLFISIVPVVLLSLSQLYLTHNSKLLPNARRRDELLADYDSETSNTDVLIDKSYRSGLDLWRSESPWGQENSYKISPKKSPHGSVAGIGIRSPTVAHDPLLDYTEPNLKDIGSYEVHRAGAYYPYRESAVYGYDPKGACVSVRCLIFYCGKLYFCADSRAPNNKDDTSSASLFDMDSQYSNDKHSFGLASNESADDEAEIT